MSEQGKRQPLGRGLSALLGNDIPQASVLAGAEDGRAVHNLPVEHLKTGEFQPRRRFDSEPLQALVDSIREKGVLEPILVRPCPGYPREFEIIAGERRWRAAQAAGLHEVPVISKELGDQEALEIALIENLQRENLTAIEEAEGYRRLMDQFGRTQEDLSREIGKSRSHVANMLRLLGLPEDVRSKVQDGNLSAGHARALLVAEDPSNLATVVIKQSLNVRQTEALVRRQKPLRSVVEQAQLQTKEKDPNTAALERDLGSLLGLRVEIAENGEAGKLTFYYENLEQLDDILQRLTVTPN